MDVVTFTGSRDSDKDIFGGVGMGTTFQPKTKAIMNIQVQVFV